MNPRFPPTGYPYPSSAAGVQVNQSHTGGAEPDTRPQANNDPTQQQIYYGNGNDSMEPSQLTDYRRASTSQAQRRTQYPAEHHPNTDYTPRIDDEGWSQDSGYITPLPPSAIPIHDPHVRHEGLSGSMHPTRVQPSTWNELYSPIQTSSPSRQAQPPPAWATIHPPNTPYPGSNGGVATYTAVSGQSTDVSWSYPAASTSHSYDGHAAHTASFSSYGNTQNIAPEMNPSSASYDPTQSPSSPAMLPQMMSQGSMGYMHPSASFPGPFFGFPEEDDSRGLSYHRGTDYTKQTNSRLLGVQPPSDYAEPGSDHQYHASVALPPLPLPMTIHASRVRRAIAAVPDLSEQDREKLKYYKKCLPHSDENQRHALFLSKEQWLLSDEPEPPVEGDSDPTLPNVPSRFDFFFRQDGNHVCHWIKDDGEQCGHTAPRRERALGHARSHFDYKPFHCDGQCGRGTCSNKYHCQSALGDHIRREGKRNKKCTVCGREISVQNMKRHMKTHEPRKRSKIKKVVDAIGSAGRAIKRKISRSLSPPLRESP